LSAPILFLFFVGAWLILFIGGLVVFVRSGLETRPASKLIFVTNLLQSGAVLQKCYRSRIHIRQKLLQSRL
jgi:hypothetical protein